MGFGKRLRKSFKKAAHVVTHPVEAVKNPVKAIGSFSSPVLNTVKTIHDTGIKTASTVTKAVGTGVRDVALGLAAMTKRTDLVVPSAVPAPRIGMVTQAFAGAPEPSGAEALQRAARAAEQAGATVREIAVADVIAEAWRIHPDVQEFEAHQSLAWEYGQNYEAMPPLLRGRLDESKGGTPAEYDAAMDVTLRARQALAGIFDEVDVLLTLSAPGAAPKGLTSTGDPRYNRLWTLMGVPCVNVPTLVAEAGLPVGVTVIAPFGGDAKALAAASFVEDALGK